MEDNIRMDPREVGWECVDWIHLAQDRDQWSYLLTYLICLLTYLLSRSRSQWFQVQI